MDEIYVEITSNQGYSQVKLKKSCNLKEFQEFLDIQIFTQGIQSWYRDESLRTVVGTETSFRQMMQEGILNAYSDSGVKLHIVTTENQTFNNTLQIEIPETSHIPQILQQYQEYEEVFGLQILNLVLNGEIISVQIDANHQISDIKDFLMEEQQILVFGIYLDETLQIQLDDNRTLRELGIQNDNTLYIANQQEQQAQMILLCLKLEVIVKSMYFKTSNFISDIKKSIMEKYQVLVLDIYLDENFQIKLDEDRTLGQQGINKNTILYLRVPDEHIRLTILIDGMGEDYIVNQKSNINFLNSKIIEIKNLNPEKLKLLYFKDEACHFPLNLNLSMVEAGLQKKDKIYAQIVCQQVFEQKIENFSEQCAICLTNKKSFATLPCGHYNYCEICICKINDICAICKVKVTSKIKIYG